MVIVIVMVVVILIVMVVVILIVMIMKSMWEFHILITNLVVQIVTAFLSILVAIGRRVGIGYGYDNCYHFMVMVWL